MNRVITLNVYYGSVMHQTYLLKVQEFIIDIITIIENTKTYLSMKTDFLAGKAYSLCYGRKYFWIFKNDDCFNEDLLTSRR